MTLQTEFVDLPLERLHSEASIMKGEGWRFMQTHAVHADDGVDLYYSFMKDGLARNYRVRGVQKGTPVPSITDLFLAAFVFENEARELFGVDMRDIAIDFQGALYAPAESEPMTIVTPEQKAAREKARKAALAKAAKESGAASEEAPAKGMAGGFVMTPERRARLDAKLATMSPDKVAKVEAALKAREAEAASAGTGSLKAADAAAPTGEPKQGQAAVETPFAADEQRDEVLEEKIASMDPAKADKVRAALGMNEAGSDVGAPVAKAAQAGQADEAPATSGPSDADLEARLAAMDPEKAAKVRAALAAKGVK